ncbi:uncharacterized protein B0T23DRAFT_452420 [Neurospora hispaniola]|uniref:Uncharacterized protein n=1 Tax=Neurospora hispaniola TaxID=588809 RepID=A0AAJ0MS60_9PEZI|nr:hypothetical protein B0T23DRAFT_452420 [Neurospora hispaniola]
MTLIGRGGQEHSYFYVQINHTTATPKKGNCDGALSGSNYKEHDNEHEDNTSAASSSTGAFLDQVCDALLGLAEEPLPKLEAT